MTPRWASLGLVALLFALGGCSDSKDSADPGSGSDTSGTDAGSAGPITWNVLTAETKSAADPPPPFPDDVKAAVQGTFDEYLAGALLGPLRSGQGASDMGNVFSLASLPRLDTADRAALLEEGLPAAENIRAEQANLAFTRLAGSEGDTQMVGVDLFLVLVAEAGDTSIRIERSGQFLLLPEDGRWRIDAYKVRVTRDTPGAGTTTTVAESPGGGG